MRLLRSFPILCFTLVLLSIVGLCIAQNSVGMLLMAGALAAISWYVTEGPRGRSLPRWVSNVLVIAVSLNVVVELMQDHHDVLGVLSRFALWLTLIKLYERRSPRDHAHLLALSLLLMLTGALSSADLLFGIVLLAYAILGLYVLLLFQLYASYENAREERSRNMPAEYRLAPPAKPILGPQAGTHFRALTGAVAVSGMMLSVVIFAVFPRGIGEGMLKEVVPRKASMQQRAAFSPEINLMHGSRITESRRAVMSVQLLDHLDRPMRMANPLLLRGAALNHYDGRGRWRAGQNETRSLITLADKLLPLVDFDHASPTVIRQVFDPLFDSSVLFSAFTPIAVETGRDSELLLDRATHTITRVKWGGSGRGRAYTIYGEQEPSDDVLDMLAPTDALGIRSSPGNAAILNLARELLTNAGQPISPPGGRRGGSLHDDEAVWAWNATAARVFMNYLHSPAFRYTTDLSDVTLNPDRDPVEAFLLDIKRGHCEYFASAMALLCRHVRIPARVVTGYVAYEYDDVAQHYIVLESNAHAWVEVRTGRNRWTTFDPTPENILRDIHQPQAPSTARLRWLYDRFDGAWSRTIVGFDDAAQRQLAQRTWESTMTERVQGAIAAIADWIDRVNHAFFFGPRGYVYMAIVGVLLIICVIVFIKILKRTRLIRSKLRLDRIRGSDQQRLIRQLGFYLDMLTLLDRAKLSKPVWQPPINFAAQVASSGRPGASRAAELVRGLSSLFYEARYGGRPLTAEQIAESRTLLAQLAESLNVKP